MATTANLGKKEDSDDSKIETWKSFMENKIQLKNTDKRKVEKKNEKDYLLVVVGYTKMKFLEPDLTDNDNKFKQPDTNTAVIEVPPIQSILLDESRKRAREIYFLIKDTSEKPNKDKTKLKKEEKVWN